MELILNMDRLQCIALEFLNIVETGEFESVKLSISETELKITPLAGQRKIVLVRA